MTSNLGAGKLAPLGSTRRRVPSGEAEVIGLFGPESLNRIDALVRPEPLDADAVRAIALRALREIDRREGVVRR